MLKTLESVGYPFAIQRINFIRRTTFGSKIALKPLKNCIVTKFVTSVGLIALLSLEIGGQDNNGQIGGAEQFYSHPALVVQNIYPNPASNVAILNYSVFLQDTKAKIIVHDLLGTMTKDYPLNPFEKILKIDTQDLKEGVYFYTLYTDGENKVTKKLIIKK